MKYRIKQYDALCTRYKAGTWAATEQIETRFQIEMRVSGFWGWLWGWSDIGVTFDTEQQARDKVEHYKRLDNRPRFNKRETYIEID